MPHQLVLKYLSSKANFHLQLKTVHAFQREMCRDNTFALLLKALLRELFTNKGEILSCRSIKPCKSRKNSQEYYTRTRNKSSPNSPPFQGNVQIPPFPGTMHSQIPGVCPGGGCLSFNLTGTLHVQLLIGSECSASFHRN